MDGELAYVNTDILLKPSYNYIAGFHMTSLKFKLQNY